MELAPRAALYEQPMHPYTRALLSAIPIPDPERERNKPMQILHGDLPSPLHPPSGCVFRTRCPVAEPRCAGDVPQLHPINAQTKAACVLL
jgi:oligopeptide transport system ATP-binding protein